MFEKEMPESELTQSRKVWAVDDEGHQIMIGGSGGTAEAIQSQIRCIEEHIL
jgi:hypothetical protein